MWINIEKNSVQILLLLESIMIFASSGWELEKYEFFPVLLIFLLDFQNATYGLDVCGIECYLWNNRFLQRGCWQLGENWQVFCKLRQSSTVATTFENNFQICRLWLLHVDDLIRRLYDDHWLKVVGDVPERNYDKKVILSIPFQKQ